MHKVKKIIFNFIIIIVIILTLFYTFLQFNKKNNITIIKEFILENNIDLYQSNNEYTTDLPQKLKDYFTSNESFKEVFVRFFPKFIKSKNSNNIIQENEIEVNLNDYPIETENNIEQETNIKNKSTSYSKDKGKINYYKIAIDEHNLYYGKYLNKILKLSDYQNNIKTIEFCNYYSMAEYNDKVLIIMQYNLPENIFLEHLEILAKANLSHFLILNYDSNKKIGTSEINLPSLSFYYSPECYNTLDIALVDKNELNIAINSMHNNECEHFPIFTTRSVLDNEYKNTQKCNLDIIQKKYQSIPISDLENTLNKIYNELINNLKYTISLEMITIRMVINPKITKSIEDLFTIVEIIEHSRFSDHNVYISFSKGYFYRQGS